MLLGPHRVISTTTVQHVTMTDASDPAFASIIANFEQAVNA